MVKVKEDKSGCTMSPDLLSLYSQTIITELEKKMVGMSNGKKNINIIRYADDTVLIADTEIKLQRLIEKLNEKCKKFGLRKNISKTEVIGLTKRAWQLPINIKLEGRVLSQVGSFEYLGTMMYEDVKCDADIKTRI